MPRFRSLERWPPVAATASWSSEPKAMSEKECRSLFFPWSTRAW
ncbi:MAG: hypothetical protein ACK4N5_01065 [Myxococcales bacterium]